MGTQTTVVKSFTPCLISAACSCGSFLASSPRGKYSLSKVGACTSFRSFHDSTLRPAISTRTSIVTPFRNKITSASRENGSPTFHANTFSLAGSCNSTLMQYVSVSIFPLACNTSYTAQYSCDLSPSNGCTGGVVCAAAHPAASVIDQAAAIAPKIHVAKLQSR